MAVLAVEETKARREDFDGFRVILTPAGCPAAEKRSHHWQGYSWIASVDLNQPSV